MSQNIFTHTKTSPVFMVGNITSTDDILNDREANETLNKYKKFNAVELTIPPLGLEAKVNDNGEYVMVEENGKKRPDYLPGHKYRSCFSLFSKSHGVGAENMYQLYGNAPLMDSPYTRKIIREHSDCSVKTLVRLSEAGRMGLATYDYADFMFCKHLGRISNNYLITLRRFPTPAGDYIRTIMEDRAEMEQDSEMGVPRQKHLPDIGRLVTWMGTPGNEMTNILKYSVNLPYKEWKAEVQDVGGTDAGGGMMGGLLQLASSKNSNLVMKGGSSTSLGTAGMLLKPFGIPMGAPSTGAYDGWAYHRDRNKPWGPVDSIAKTYIRAGGEDGGIAFEQSIQLQFDYEMRAFDGINAKAAFLDLIGNILMVTYTDATYWGGAVHGQGNAQHNMFANLPIYNMKAPLTFSGMVDSVVASIKDIGSLFNNGKPINGIGDLFNAVKNLGQGLFANGVAGVLNSLGRPQRQAINALVNFAPTGVWHLTIGNPRHPIMSMGNMKLDSCSIEHYGPLGLDDFPTGLRVNITLSHAQPRDNLKIEHMYQSGDNRIYTPFGKDVQKVYEKAFKVTGGRDTGHDETTGGGMESIQANTKNTAMPLDQLKNIKGDANRDYIKYFSTTDADAIRITAEEAYLGSQQRDQKTDKGGERRR